MTNNKHQANGAKLGNIVDESLRNPYLFLFVIGLLGFLILNIFPIFTSLKFKETINITELFWGIAIVLAIVERSIEIFITAWRNPRKEELEQNIRISEEKVFQSLPQKEKQEIEAKKAEIDRVRNEIDTNKAQIKTNQKTIKNKQIELEQQQQKTDKLRDDEENIQNKEAKLEAIKAVIEILKADIIKWGEDIQVKTETLQTLKNDHLALLLRVNPILDQNSSAYELNENRGELLKHKKITARYALYLGLLFGLVGSIAGIRILEPLVDIDSMKTATDSVQQLQIFKKFDLMVSALGIAGGTKLFHGLPNLISDTLSSTSSQIKAAANNPPTQQP